MNIRSSCISTANLSSKLYFYLYFAYFYKNFESYLLIYYLKFIYFYKNLVFYLVPLRI